MVSNILTHGFIVFYHHLTSFNTVKVVLDSVFVVDVKSDANLTNTDNRFNKKQEHMLPES